MRVITLNTTEFSKACSRLKGMLGDFDPDMVVAIPTGGNYVANAMFPDKPIAEISAHRASTERKKSSPILQWLLKHAPYPMLDTMRIIESYALRLSAHKPKTIDTGSIGQSVKDALRRAEKILIVDDAIDSGATAGAVASAVRDLAPKATVRIAVITVSTPKPMIQPDFSLYNNQTLARFPWSMDMKK